MPVVATSSGVARLLFPAFHGERLPIPATRISIANQTVLAIVDTGAGTHVVDLAFARQAGLPLVEDTTTDMRDMNGAAVHTYRIDNFSIEIEGIGRFDLGSVVAAELPDFLRDINVHMILSPQLISADRAIILDFPASEMSVAAFQTSPTLAGQRLTPNGITACVEKGTTSTDVANALFGVPVLIDGVTANLELDTGSDEVKIRTNAIAYSHLSSRAEPGRDNRGAASSTTSQRVRDVGLQIGDAALRIDVDGIPGRETDSCAYDGLIGFSVLRRCRMVIQGPRLFASCGAS